MYYYKSSIRSTIEISNVSVRDIAGHYKVEIDDLLAPKKLRIEYHGKDITSSVIPKVFGNR